MGKIKPGYAADDGAAAHFIDDVFAGGVSSRPKAKVFQLHSRDGQVVEETLPTRYLGAAMLVTT
jgi:hypothetical protein